MSSRCGSWRAGFRCRGRRSQIQAWSERPMISWVAEAAAIGRGRSVVARLLTRWSILLELVADSPGLAIEALGQQPPSSRAGSTLSTPRMKPPHSRPGSLKVTGCALLARESRHHSHQVDPTPPARDDCRGGDPRLHACPDSRASSWRGYPTGPARADKRTGSPRSGKIDRKKN